MKKVRQGSIFHILYLYDHLLWGIVVRSQVYRKPGRLLFFNLGRGAGGCATQVKGKGLAVNFDL